MNTLIGLIAEPLGILLSYLYGFIDNYGITLIVFTIIVKACLFPLYADQIKHSTRMADVQPKMQALQKKYANDKEMLNIKMMELYKEEKFNPMRGCLPMLIQMPIIFGLFALLRNPTVFIKSNEMLMAVHEAFLWVPDLSQPDPWVLPILAGITTFISFSQTQNQTQMGDNTMAPMMKMMRYFFPIMIVWMGRSFPAGLTVYWFIGTLIQIFQTRVLNNWKKKKLAEKESK
ncbi:YidC/Oxa1 family membrane protein insertase [Sinanaerobacter chloroacetimidivorans]|jgi:YidC/Oxa1 family membrane protein insertase|uniref:Membrane protein insertase YidC n=1 Tax=Sinanaerobacter chloroacetimidivorans TaxID=2818044 RepID=A0A8J7W368_9FIRM|nr:YidC/Oxa1 family membrane protein insertase [Sinanaerobacter chloroacetimidivorans]MBR0598425.1 membrane protein insertase YidC [Sinanaerobacter chloroacetimidivorans]